MTKCTMGMNGCRSEKGTAKEKPTAQPRWEIEMRAQGSQQKTVWEETEAPTAQVQPPPGAGPLQL